MHASRTGSMGGICKGSVGNTHSVGMGDVASDTRDIGDMVGDSVLYSQNRCDQYRLLCEGMERGFVALRKGMRCELTTTAKAYAQKVMVSSGAAHVTFEQVLTVAIAEYKGFVASIPSYGYDDVLCEFTD